MGLLSTSSRCNLPRILFFLNSAIGLVIRLNSGWLDFFISRKFPLASFKVDQRVFLARTRHHTSIWQSCCARSILEIAWVVARVFTTPSISAMCVTPVRLSDLLMSNPLRKFAFLAAAELIEVCGCVFRVLHMAQWKIEHSTVLGEDIAYFTGLIKSSRV